MFFTNDCKVVKGYNERNRRISTLMKELEDKMKKVTKFVSIILILASYVCTTMVSGYVAVPDIVVFKLTGERKVIEPEDLQKYMLEGGWLIHGEANDVTLYNDKNEQKSVVIDEYDDLTEYIKAGWYTFPVKYVYSLDGTSKLVPAEDALEEGWYTEPHTIVYSPDEKSAIVKCSELEKALSEGWYAEPVCFMYKQGEEPIIVKETEKSSYKLDGWKDELLLQIYSTDGRTSEVKVQVVDAYKLLGWYTSQEDAVNSTAKTLGTDVTTPEISISSRTISVFVNGKKLAFDVDPVIINGNTMVPLRGIFESLGAKIEWNNETRAVVATRKGTRIVLPVYSSIMVVDKTPITLKEAATIIDGRTMVPVRAIAEAFGVDVFWRDEVKIVSIYEDSEKIEYFEMYRPDRTKATVEKNLSDEYKAVGWGKTIEDIKVTIYTLDGREKKVFPDEVEKYKGVGWYDNIEDVQITVYAKDKSKVIFKYQLDDYKKVGWYEPITVYAEDGRTKLINPFKLDDYKKVGWYPAVTMYAKDGRTLVISPFMVETYKELGWYTEPQVQNSTSSSSDAVLTAEEIYSKCSSAVFYIETYDRYGRKIGSGSGFFINNKGVAVTNYHVIDGAYSIKVQLVNSQKSYNVKKIINYSSVNDWATIQVDISGNSFLKIGDPQTVVGGATIYAIGSPLGLQNTISEGIISNPKRNDDGTNYIQITASISHGSSGGALINKKGEVIGITSASYIYGQSLNLAVPMTYLSSALEGYIN